MGYDDEPGIAAQIRLARAAVNGATGPRPVSGFDRGRPATDTGRMEEARAELTAFELREPDDSFIPQGRVSA